MVIKLSDSKDVDLDRKIMLRQDIQDILLKHGLGKTHVHIAGTVITEGWMTAEAFSALAILSPMGAIVMCMIVYVIYRSLVVVGLTAIVGLTATIWGVGVSALVFGDINIMVAATPLLVMVISTSDTIHLTSAYSQEIAAGSSPHKALEIVIRDVGGACVLTSVTTSLGLMSLTIVPVMATRHLALSAGVGVGEALLLALTIVPIGFLLLRFSPPVNTGHQSGGMTRAIWGGVHVCRRLSMNYPKTVTALHILLVVGALIAAHDLHFARIFPSGFPKRILCLKQLSFFGPIFPGRSQSSSLWQANRKFC